MPDRPTLQTHRGQRDNIVPYALALVGLRSAKTL